MNLTTINDQQLSALIVDDEAKVRKIMKEILESLGIFSFVIEAENGLDALQKCTKQTFDLVVSDLIMPKSDGIELIDNVLMLNRKKKQNEQSSVMLFSGKITHEKVNDALKVGIRHIVMKSCDRERIRKKVIQVLLKEKKNKVELSES